MTKIININYGTSGFIPYDLDLSNEELPEIQIDKENKLIHYSDKLPIGQYIIGDIELVIKPNLHYNIHNVLYQEDITFTPIFDNIYNFESYNLPIKFDNNGKFNTKDLDINEYNFNINDCLISFTVLPSFNYSSDEFIFNNKILSSIPTTYPKNGTFNCIYPIDENGIIDLSNLDIGDYNINVSYTINNITNYCKYSVTILSELIYQNNYECFEFTDFTTEQPIYQKGGTFSIEEINEINIKNKDSDVSTIYYYDKNNIFEILNNGIIKCNCEANNYELTIKYSKSKLVKINILVKPYISYQNINKTIYGTKYISNKPIYYYNDSLFFLINNDNFDINEEGIITQINLDLVPDNYNLLVIYSKNNINIEINITLTILPFIELINNKYEYFINEVNETKINYLPLKTKFNEHSILKQNGDIIIDTVGKFSTEFIYFFNDISNSITYEYIVKPIVKYNNYSNVSAENIIPEYFYPKNGIFTQTNRNASEDMILFSGEKEKAKENTINNIDMFINSQTGEIHFNNLDIGTYDINVTYTINKIKSNYTFQIKIEPTINIEELNIYYDDVPKEDIDIMNMINYNISCKCIFENNILNLKDLDCGTYEYIITFNYLDTFIKFPIKINILKSELKLIFTCINKIYDGNNFAYVSCNNKSIIYEAKYNNEKAEYYKDIYIKIIKFDDNNYFVNDTKIKGSILKKPINPIFIGIDKEYDGTNNAQVKYECDFKIDSVNSFYSIINVGKNTQTNHEDVKLFSGALAKENTIIIKNIKFYDENHYIEKAEYEIEGNILPKKIVPNIIVKDKIYDNDIDAKDYIYFKNIKISSFDAYYEDSNVGDKIIFIKNVKLINYIIEDFTIIGKIIPQEIKLDLISINKCYDGTDIASLQDNILLKSYEAKYTNINVGLQNISITNIQLDDSNFFMQEIGRAHV